MTNQTAPAQQRDNLLGICHALGETFGFNPLFLRLALLAGVMIDAEMSLIAYFGAGVAVLVAKLAAPDRSKAARKARTLTLA
jgi:phage shock protein PspC (stress-responsive transcriptional regulator)